MKFIFDTVAEREAAIEQKRKLLETFFRNHFTKEFPPGREGQILEALEAFTKELREAVDGVVAPEPRLPKLEPK